MIRIVELTGDLLQSREEEVISRNSVDKIKYYTIRVNYRKKVAAYFKEIENILRGGRMNKLKIDLIMNLVEQYAISHYYWVITGDKKKQKVCSNKMNEIYNKIKDFLKSEVR